MGVPGWVFATIVGCYVVAALGLGLLHTRGAVLMWIPVALVAVALLITWRTADD